MIDEAFAREAQGRCVLVTHVDGVGLDDGLACLRGFVRFERHILVVLDPGRRTREARR